jgi:hypothetical protein
MAVERAHSLAIGQSNQCGGARSPCTSRVVLSQVAAVLGNGELRGMIPHAATPTPLSNSFLGPTS